MKISHIFFWKRLNFRLRLKTEISVWEDSGMIDRGFSLVESLHWTWDLAIIATASPWGLPQMLQLRAWDWGLYTFNLLCQKTIWSKNGKEQSCSKLPKMARKLIENVFWNFWPNFFKTCVRKKCCQKMEKTKFDRNCLKWREICFGKFRPNFLTSLLSLMGVTIEKGSHWLPKATIAVDSRWAKHKSFKKNLLKKSFSLKKYIK